MAKTSFLSQFYVKIDGEQIPEELHDNLLEITVDTSLYLPEMFTISVRDPKLEWVDSKKWFDIGKPVEISAQASDDLGGGEGTLMKGEITALEPNFSAEGETSFVVRGYSQSHRLHRGKKSRTFLKQTDKEIVGTIAQELGLDSDIDSTSVKHEYVAQSNQTNMEFLQSRAARLGYKVHVADKKLYFKKSDANLDSAIPELDLADGLRSFRPYISATHQASKVTVVGWDSKLKKIIKAEASPNASLNQGGIGETGGAVAKKTFGDADMVVVDRPVATPDEAKAMAETVASDLSQEFMQAEGQCYGNPKVKAGCTIKIKGIGERFSGNYFITAATHIVTEGAYDTHFTISGRQPNTVSHLLNGKNGYGGAAGEEQLMRGVTIGIVTNNKDEENLGRVKVKYPWLDDKVESDWMRVAAPGAGDKRGVYWLPEVNDEVLIAYDHGNLHHPYVIGSLWNSKDKPPLTTAEARGSDGKIKQRIMKSRSGHVILLDDDSGKEKIVIVDKSNKNSIVISTEQNSITVEANKGITLESGGQKVVIDGQGKKIQLSGGGRMVTLGNGQVEIT